MELYKCGISVASSCHQGSSFELAKALITPSLSRGLAKYTTVPSSTSSILDCSNQLKTLANGANICSTSSSAMFSTRCSPIIIASTMPSAASLTQSNAKAGGIPVQSTGGHLNTVTSPQVHSRQMGTFKRYQCGYCGKVVTNIQIHVRRHTNEKPYICRYCDKRFTNSGDLQIHTRIHTGEKPYRCPLCGKSYRTIGNFNSHVKTHDNGERPHRCALCNETFEQMRDWFSHLRSNHKQSVIIPTVTTVSHSPSHTNSDYTNSPSSPLPTTTATNTFMTSADNVHEQPPSCQSSHNDSGTEQGSGGAHSSKPFT